MSPSVTIDLNSSIGPADVHAARLWLVVLVANGELVDRSRRRLMSSTGSTSKGMRRRPTQGRSARICLVHRKARATC
jgi:hypothetical protein